jgi:hypothetical protein
MANLLQEELDRKVPVTLDGKTRNMSKRQIVVRQQVDRAVKGCTKAFVTLLRMEAEAEAGAARTERQEAAQRSEIGDAVYQSIVSDYVADLKSGAGDEGEGDA